MEGYIKYFEEQCYSLIFLQFAEETILSFAENEEIILEAVKTKLNGYLGQIVAFQKEESGEAVAEITCSFLYTLIDEKPGFRLECYGKEGHIVGESMKTDFLSADWLTVKLDEFVDRLENHVKQEGLRQYVRPAELEVLKLRAVRSLLYYFAGRFKYILPVVLDRKILAKVKKEESFVITIGEYMDWQKVLYAVLPEVDIFNCGQNTVLSFRNFPVKYYKEKEFDELVLKQSKFCDCTFFESEIKKCNMNDCIFDHCKFEKVTITDTQMAGALFINCTFLETQFTNTIFDGADAAMKEEEYFEAAEFYRCSFTKCSFEQCRMEEVVWTECSEEEVQQ